MLKSSIDSTKIAEGFGGCLTKRQVVPSPIRSGAAVQANSGLPSCLFQSTLEVSSSSDSFRLLTGKLLLFFTFR